MDAIVRAGILAATAVMLASCSFEPPIVGYRTITVDSATQRVEWQNPIRAEADAAGASKPVIGSYYQVFTGQNGTSVEHFFKRDATTPRVKYSYLATRLEDHLVYESINTREILSGPFGTVYTQKTCFFHMPMNYTNDITVHMYGSGLGEPPASSDAPPDGAPSTLTNVSVIRVVRGGPAYIVAAAIYAPNGHATSLSVEGGGGDSVQASVVRGAGIRHFNRPQLDDVEAALMAAFGLPHSISIERALAQGPLGLATPSEGIVERDAINLHYAYDRWLRQDEYLAGGEHHTRYLSYVRTPEDIALDAPCAERFRAQPAWRQ